MLTEPLIMFFKFNLMLNKQNCALINQSAHVAF